MLAHNDSGVFSSVSNTADDSILKRPAGVFSPHDGKFQYIQVKFHIFIDSIHRRCMNSGVPSEMEPTLKRDGSKFVDQMERATVTKRLETDPSADHHLPPWPTSSRNDPTGSQDVVKAGVSVTTHHPQL